MEEKRKPMDSQLTITESQWQQRKKVKLERMTELPDEIIDEILSRLPVKSLLRFKCVCKSWLSLISNSNFRHKKEYESILVVKKSSETLTASIYSMDDNKAVSESSFSLTCNEGNVSVCSNFCNGLFIIGLGESLFLFNPSTRYFAKVLNFPKGYRNKVSIIGLCYDASINDYKIVVGIVRGPIAFPVVVASLKTKRWAPVGFPSHYSVVNVGPIVNERMHWIVEDKIYKKNNELKHAPFQPKKLIRYDPSANVFEEFPSPPNGKAKVIFCLGVLGGCICMARRVDYGEFVKQKVEVLIMKEYGVRESWTTLFCCSLDFRPILITNNWDIFLTEAPCINSTPLFPFSNINGGVLRMENVLGLFAYNLRKKTITDLDMLWGGNDEYYTMSFVQNLASPPVGCEWDEMPHKETLEEDKLIHIV